MRVSAPRFRGWSRRALGTKHSPRKDGVDRRRHRGALFLLAFAFAAWPAVRQASFSSALLGIADARRPPSVAGQDDDANHAGSSSVVGENAVLRERGRGVEGFDDFEAIRVGAPDLRAEGYVAEVDAEVNAVRNGAVVCGQQWDC